MNTMAILCEDCKHYLENKDKHGTEGVCTRFPPKVFPIMIPPKMVGQEPTTLLRMFSPVVNAKQHCGEFEPKMMLRRD